MFLFWSYTSFRWTFDFYLHPLGSSSLTPPPLLVCLFAPFLHVLLNPEKERDSSPQSCEQKGQVEREETPSFKLAMLQRSVSGPDSVIA